MGLWHWSLEFFYFSLYLVGLVIYMYWFIFIYVVYTYFILLKMNILHLIKASLNISSRNISLSVFFWTYRKLSIYYFSLRIFSVKLSLKKKQACSSIPKTIDVCPWWRTWLQILCILCFECILQFMYFMSVGRWLVHLVGGWLVGW